MVTVYKFPITKGDVQSLPSQDRANFILAGHALNHLGMWLKLVTLSTNEGPEPIILAHLRAAQFQMLLRALYSLLYETWIWLKNSESYIESTYLMHCTTGEQSAYERLRAKFEGSSLFGKIRNQFGSHFPKTAQIEEAFSYASDEEDWSWYMSETLTNSFWGSSEVTIGFGTVKLAGIDDPVAGLKHVIAESMDVTNHFQDFLAGILRVIMELRFGRVPQPTSILDIDKAPRGDEFELPFLLEPPFGQQA